MLEVLYLSTDPDIWAVLPSVQCPIVCGTACEWRLFFKCVCMAHTCESVMKVNTQPLVCVCVLCLWVHKLAMEVTVQYGAFTLTSKHDLWCHNENSHSLWPCGVLLCVCVCVMLLPYYLRFKVRLKCVKVWIFCMWLCAFENVRSSIFAAFCPQNVHIPASALLGSPAPHHLVLLKQSRRATSQKAPSSATGEEPSPSAPGYLQLKWSCIGHF